MNEGKQKIILNNKLFPAEHATIPVTSRGLMYGDGCFETFRSYQGRFLKLEEHLKRLNEGLDFLSLRLPEGLKPKKIRPQLKKLLSANNLMNDDAVVRLQVWRKGGRGYRPVTYEANYSIIATPLAKQNTACRLAAINTKRIPSKALPSRYKLSNGLNYIIAAKQAIKKNADDALMETIDGTVSETTIANIFWLKNETVYTPSVDCDILPGITRSIVLKLLKESSQIKVKEGAYPLSAVKNADAVWLCNSLKEVQSVSSIDGVKFNTEAPLIHTLKEIFQSFRNEQLSK